MSEPFYRVLPDEANPGCPHCGHGRHWIIVDLFEKQHHTAYTDEDNAQEICDDLNAAFEAGQKARP